MFPFLNLFKKNYNYIFMLMLFLSGSFYACKRSNSQQMHREYDPVLVQILNKLDQKYIGKKVRINTWNKKADAYQDIVVLDEDELATKQILTIGDSVQFIGIDLNHADGIQAKIRYKNKLTGYIPYNFVEEFEPATVFDPDLKD